MGTARLDILTCPACGHPLRRADCVLACHGCGADYPFLNDTPIVVAGARVESRVEPPNPDAIAGLLDTLGLPAERSGALADCYRLRFTFSNPVIQTESEQFLSRLRVGGAAIPDPYPPAEGRRADEPAATDPEAEVALDVLVWPTHVEPGELFALTVVLRNLGQEILSSRGEAPFLVSYTWSCDHPEQLRTELLVDLVPGRQMSFPVRVRAPDDIGPFRLSVTPVIEGLRWIEKAAAGQTIVVKPAARPPLAVDWPITRDLRDYDEDHRFAFEALSRWVDALPPGRPARILELGGNYHPMVQYLAAEIEAYNLDIDPFGLMTLSIKKAGTPAAVTNVVADGLHLPFPDGSLDAVVMFSTFHHFPDPAALLRAIRRKLAPGGFLALLCEPVGHVFAGAVPASFLEEINKGVYEQSFAPWEYRALVEGVGFRTVEAWIDHGSLKLQARIDTGETG